MQSTEIKVKNRIYGNGRGWCFTPMHFIDLASYDSTRKSLMRLEKKGIIKRLTAGLYYYPKTHKVLGELPPDISEIATAIAYKSDTKIQPSGAYAANLLGFSEQIPAKIVFLTDGESKRIKNTGTTEIYFKNTTPKNMATAGTITGLVIQALKFIKKQNITDQMILNLKNKLTNNDKKIISKNYHYAPAWIVKIIRDNLLSEEHE